MAPEKIMREAVKRGKFAVTVVNDPTTAKVPHPQPAMAGVHYTMDCTSILVCLKEVRR